MHENEDRLHVTILSPNVDLSVARSTITDIELPPDGRLLFLATLKSERKGSAVLHVPASVATAEHSPPQTLDDQEAAAYKPRPLYTYAHTAPPGNAAAHRQESGSRPSVHQTPKTWNSETCPAGQPLLAVKVSRT
ncbi:hypothetical protein OOK36_41955 [Streptomyces sp. NBC_00365]|uniref:hypothetical protein n=1 Tax=Streptomyces sp. NBC_00365 TaxID=2975726 RepID=UPI002258B94C|nr:hypothetical protein [Streptomyces sp. NBC_00365]MCX5095296.1 hypothetical protein [Streptomyces sp. NBC_00365]